MGIGKGIILMAMMSLAFASYGEYTLKIARGKYPEDVKVENINGNIPMSVWYKNGWTEEGWSVGDYGTIYNIALSPSYVEEGVCENALILPSMKIQEGEWLSWDGCEIYPKFSDSYTVEFRANGSEVWDLLGKYTESKSKWTTHMIDLSPYCGIEGELRFVCRSDNGYMLGLNNISIKKPIEYSFFSANLSPKFFAVGELSNGDAAVEIRVLNTGAPMSSAVMGIMVEENIVSTVTDGDYWPTGETREFRIPLPVSTNVRTNYSVYIEPFGGETQIIEDSFAYCTSFKRNLYVDKGTGMWCNSCPNGTLAVEQLEETYGDAIIVGETHNGDLLANDIDFTWLKFHSIPQLMLNRVLSTKSDNASKFEDQICIPTEMEINITDMNVRSNGDLYVKAEVKTSKSFDAMDSKFRIGYLLTRNVNGNENTEFYQKNICTSPKQMQYRYLPSMMLYPMCSFPNVTIPSQIASLSENPAFTGIDGSLPQSLASGEVYESEWHIPLPDGFDSFNGMRLVAFILDANKRIINSTASYIDDYTGIEYITAAGSKTERIFTLDGLEVKGERSSLLPGLYIIDGVKILIK